MIANIHPGIVVYFGKPAFMQVKRSSKDKVVTSYQVNPQTMETGKIIFFRNFLFRSFIVGVLFAVLFGVLTFALWDVGVQLSNSYFKVDEREFGEMLFAFFMNIRIVLVFIFLAPALALHWMLKMKSN